MMKRNIVIVLALALLVTLVSCSGKDRELTERVDTLTKTVTTLEEENKILKARVDQLETAARNMTSRIDGVEESLLFDVPDYPVKYQLTEASYEEFKAQIVEIAKNYAGATGVSDAELEEALMMLEYIEDGSLMEEFLTEASCIELIDDNTVLIDGDTASYTIKDGALYVYGGMVGMIDEEAITITEEDDGISFSVRFYRTTPLSGGKMTIGEKIRNIETTISRLQSPYYY